MHEIITLQLGQPSNYLAIHFWNAQESYFTYGGEAESPVNHDVHWRPGVGADGSDTFMPRTVIYDLKGGFGSLRKINALYETPDDGGASQGLWEGRTVVHRETPIEVAAYQQSLDQGGTATSADLPTTRTVRYWSDFNRVFFHPRSVVQLNEYELGSSMQPFEKWPRGEDLFASLDKEHDLLDRDLRPFVEEADHMQGVQVFTTIDDAWAGFAARYVERMRDEYGKSVVWIWALQDPVEGLNREKRLSRMANKAHSLTELYKQASLIVPMSIPRSSLLLSHHVSLDASSPWHTSALLTTAIETVAIPSRLRHSGDSLGGNHLDGMADWLNVMGKQTIATLQMEVAVDHDASQLPRQSSDPRLRGAELRLGTADIGHDKEEGEETVELPIDFTPPDELGISQAQPRRRARKVRHVFGQIVSSRGVTASSREKDGTAPQKHQQFVRQQDSGKAAVRRYHTDLKYPQPDSFPLIFRKDHPSPSSVASEQQQQLPPPPLQGSVPMVASLTTDSSTCDRLKLLRTTVARSIGVEDRENLSNELALMAEEYHEGWSSGSDEGDDD